jgi:AcrR family transcriptional regulator
MPRAADPDLADRIVRVTAEMLEDRGIDGVTMRGVAAAAGCSATTIYQRFENKDALLDHAVVRGLEWFVEVQSAADAGGSGRNRIAATSHAYVEWGITNPAMYRLMFEQRLPKPAEGAALGERRRGWDLSHAMLAEILASRTQDARPVDASLATDLVFVSLHGIVSLAISGRLIGPLASREQQLGRASAIVDALVAQWVDSWELAA